MAKYIVLRLVTAVAVLIGVSIVTFLLLHIIASSPGAAALGQQATPQAIAAYNKANGYDDPLQVQYVHYLGNLLHGNLGYSYKLNQSVNALIAENAPRTLYLTGVSLVLSILISIPIGMYQAVRRNTIGDYAATAGSFTLYSMPSFFLGLLLIQAFALSLHVFPAEASQSTSVIGVILDPRGMILPIVTFTAVNVAGFSRYMRSSTIDNLAQEYVRTAKAKGLSERQVLWRHLLKNSSLPLITLIGLSIPRLLAGNLLIETLFNYPGLGLLFYNALGNEDYNVLLAYILIGAVLTVLGNLIADIAVAAVDPRVRVT